MTDISAIGPKELMDRSLEKMQEQLCVNLGLITIHLTNMYMHKHIIKLCRYGHGNCFGSEAAQRVMVGQCEGSTWDS